MNEGKAEQANMSADVPIFALTKTESCRFSLEDKTKTPEPCNPIPVERPDTTNISPISDNTDTEQESSLSPFLIPDYTELIFTTAFSPRSRPQVERLMGRSQSLTNLVQDNYDSEGGGSDERDDFDDYKEGESKDVEFEDYKEDESKDEFDDDKEDEIKDWCSENSSAHQFKKVSFSRPTFCQHCTTMMWGLVKQGLRCSVCKYTCHTRCKAAVQTSTVCKPRRSHSIAKKQTKHFWRSRHFNSPTFCNGCKSMLYGMNKQGYGCYCCGVIAHKGCVNQVEDMNLPCKLGFIDSTSDRCETLCQWVLGNITSSYPHCLVCHKAVCSNVSLTGYRCMWCKHAVHRQCMTEDHTQHKCSFGAYATAVIPPHWLRERPNYNTNDNSNSSNDTDNPPEDQWLTQSSEDNSRFIVTIPSDIPCDIQPVAVFINKRSGGHEGSKVYKGMCTFLNPLQVFDLGEGGPEEGLRLFTEIGAKTNGYRVLACGGDGTAGWLLSALDSFDRPGVTRPPLGIIPLGTGNDLARTLGWGGGYNNESVRLLIDQLQRSEVRMMDRWKVCIGPTGGSGDELKHTFTMNNYFSLGIDAKIALGFHTAREKHGDWFKSRMANKLIYAGLGAKEMFDGCVAMGRSVDLYIDDVLCNKLTTPSVQGIVILNMTSYAGGIDMWNLKEPKIVNDAAYSGQARRKSTSNPITPTEALLNIIEPINQRLSLNEPPQLLLPQAIDDGLLEVVGLRSSLHVGQIKVSLSSAIRLGQGRKVRLEMRPSLPAIPAQVDGEPWLQEAAVIEISRYNTVPMLTVPRKADRSPSSRELTVVTEL